MWLPLLQTDMKHRWRDIKEDISKIFRSPNDTLWENLSHFKNQKGHTNENNAVDLNEIE